MSNEISDEIFRLQQIRFLSFLSRPLFRWHQSRQIVSTALSHALHFRTVVLIHSYALVCQTTHSMIYESNRSPFMWMRTNMTDIFVLNHHLWTTLWNSISLCMDGFYCECNGIPWFVHVPFVRMKCWACAVDAFDISLTQTSWVLRVVSFMVDFCFRPKPSSDFGHPHSVVSEIIDNILKNDFIFSNILVIHPAPPFITYDPPFW